MVDNGGGGLFVVQLYWGAVIFRGLICLILSLWKTTVFFVHVCNVFPRFDRDSAVIIADKVVVLFDISNNNNTVAKSYKYLVKIE